MYLLISLSDIQLLVKAILCKNEKISRVSFYLPFTVENQIELYKMQIKKTFQNINTFSFGILSLGSGYYTLILFVYLLFIYLLILNYVFKFQLVYTQCNISFRCAIYGFVTYIYHSVLITIYQLCLALSSGLFRKLMLMFQSNDRSESEMVR